METMKREKQSKGALIANDIFVSAGTLVACFGIIAIFAVGGFGAICSLIGLVRSFASDSVAAPLVLSLCGLATATLMFMLGIAVSRIFLDGISDYIVSRRNNADVRSRR